VSRTVKFGLKLLSYRLRINQLPPTMFERQYVRTGLRRIQNCEFAPCRGQQGLKRALEDWIRRFAQELLEVSDVLFANELLQSSLPQRTIGSREILRRTIDFVGSSESGTGTVLNQHSGGTGAD
jgi:hypothetical protein